MCVCVCVYGYVSWCLCVCLFRISVAFYSSFIIYSEESMSDCLCDI